jgi:hypothetical protein
MSKRWMLLLLVAGVAAGCGTLPSLTEPPKPAKVAAKEAKDTPAEPKVKRPTTLVTPEQVTDANAHEMSKALWDELDRDSQTEMR